MWYERAVGYIAARGIALGTGDGNFSPEANLTGGQYIVILLRAYGIAPDANIEDNYSDVADAYYTAYLATLKRLAISHGT